MAEENKQEILLQLSMLQQQSEKLQEKIQLINQQIFSMESLKEGLDKIKDGEKKEILANIGKGVFIKTEIKSKDLIVDIGNNILVKKKPEETQGIINKQIEQMEDLKKQLIDRLEDLNLQLQHLIMKAQSAE